MPAPSLRALMSSIIRWRNWLTVSIGRPVGHEAVDPQTAVARTWKLYEYR
jgi:hypothetical protein